MKVLLTTASSCHHSIEDMQSKVSNFCVSKSKCMAYDILHYMICMFINKLCTDFHVVKHTHGVSVQVVCNSSYIHLVAEPKDSAPPQLQSNKRSGIKIEYFGALQCQRIFAVTAPDDKGHNRFW